MSYFVQDGKYLPAISRTITNNNHTWSATFVTTGFLMLYPNALRFVSDQPFTVYQDGGAWSGSSAVTVQGQTMYTGGVTFSPGFTIVLDDTSDIFITNDVLDGNTNIPDDIWYCMNHEAQDSVAMDIDVYTHGADGNKMITATCRCR